jgi:hypothetical protein
MTRRAWWIERIGFWLVIALTIGAGVYVCLHIADSVGRDQAKWEERR